MKSPREFCKADLSCCNLTQIKCESTALNPHAFYYINVALWNIDTNVPSLSKVIRKKTKGAYDKYHFH